MTTSVRFKRLGVVIWIVGSGLLAYTRGGFAGWFLFYSALTIAVAQWGSVWRCGGFSVRRNVAETAVAGERFEMEVTVRSKRTVPFCWVRVSDEWHSRVVFLVFRREWKYRCTISGIKRGVYERERVEVRVEDMLGWFSREWIVQDPHVCVVLPQERPVPRVDRSIQVESSEEWGIRPLIPGDAGSRIHWKISTKQQRLVVSKPERAAVERWVLCLDGSGRSFERVVEYAAGWARSQSRRTVCHLLLPGRGGSKTLETFRLPSERLKMRTALAQVRPVSPEAMLPDNPMRDALKSTHRPIIPNDAAIVYMAVSPSSSAVRWLIRQRKAGREVVMFVGDKGLAAMDREMRRLLHTSGVRVWSSSVGYEFARKGASLYG